MLQLLTTTGVRPDNTSNNLNENKSLRILRDFLCINIIMSILNAAGNFIKGASQFAGGTLAQPNIDLFGINIPGIPLISFRDYFLTMMSTWVASIPLRTQFIVLIDRFPAALNSSVLQNLELNTGDKTAFDINRAKSFLTSTPYQGIVGCLFVDGVDIPSENLTHGVAPIDNNGGLIQGHITTGREAFNSQRLTIQFRETNTSFTDIIMRPWVILASHYGLVARNLSDRSEAAKDMRCNITVIQYSRSYQKLSMIPRKIWTFYDCIPLGIDSRNLTYDTEAVESYKVPFIYSRYTIKDNLYLPIPDLIDSIATNGIKGAIPRISPFQS